MIDNVPAVRPQKDEVIAAVHAAALNPLDSKLRRGEMKLMSGVRFPQAVGLEFSGVVVELGAGVDDFHVGDQVFGEGTSSCSELVVANVRKIARKPMSMTHESAAGLAMCGQAALQGLRDVGRVGPGQRVLVYGCTGGVGVFALQVAHLLGADVDGVCSTAGCTGPQSRSPASHRLSPREAERH